MTAASDSSPLIVFARIGRLDLIEAVFNQVLIPPAVWREVVTQGAGRAGEQELQRAAWIHERATPIASTFLHLPALDRSEAEAIALAAAQEPMIAVLLDDNPARRVALNAGLVVVGSGGILVLAKRRGLIPAIQPHLGNLRAAGLYLSSAVVARLLEAAGE